MALPKSLERVIKKITPQNEMEAKLLNSLIKRLDSSLAILERHFGSDCAEGHFRELATCIKKESDASCFDRYETFVERCIIEKLRRPLTEAEEMMVSEILSHITGITEMLLTLGGVVLTEAEEPEEEEQENAR